MERNAELEKPAGSVTLVFMMIWGSGSGALAVAKLHEHASKIRIAARRAMVCFAGDRVAFFAAQMPAMNAFVLQKTTPMFNKSSLNFSEIVDEFLNPARIGTHVALPNS